MLATNDHDPSIRAGAQRRVLDRRYLLAALLVVTPLGLATKMYTGPGGVWARAHAGGVFYEIFWILLVLLVWPRLAVARVALGVFTVTCALEFLQLWKPLFLEVIRGTFVGHALIGSTFSWADFPYYVIGCVAGVALVWWMDH